VSTNEKRSAERGKRALDANDAILDAGEGFFECAKKNERFF
jgi:hypothetical protein